MKCPGQDMQYWNADAIFEVGCPECGAQVEFYKDDTTRTCRACGHRFVNPKMDFGCAAYCKFAEQCIGTLPEEFVGSQDNLLKDKVAVEIKRYHRTDFKRIGLISRVARYAEKIGREEGGNLAVVLCAAYLDKLDESGGPAENSRLASSILTGLGAKDAIIQEVCALIGNSATNADPTSAESATLHDAQLIAEVEEQHKQSALEPEQAAALLAERFMTAAGQRVARDVFRHLGVA